MTPSREAPAPPRAGASSVVSVLSPTGGAAFFERDRASRHLPHASMEVARASWAPSSPGAPRMASMEASEPKTMTPLDGSLSRISECDPSRGCASVRAESALVSWRMTSAEELHVVQVADSAKASWPRSSTRSRVGPHGPSSVASASRSCTVWSGVSSRYASCTDVSLLPLVSEPSSCRWGVPRGDGATSAALPEKMRARARSSRPSCPGRSHRSEKSLPAPLAPKHSTQPTEPESADCTGCIATMSNTSAWPTCCSRTSSKAYWRGAVSASPSSDSPSAHTSLFWRSHWSAVLSWPSSSVSAGRMRRQTRARSPAVAAGPSASGISLAGDAFAPRFAPSVRGLALMVA